jgi:uncharacterized membrane protein YdbT with pleckstrin-like domain
MKQQFSGQRADERVLLVFRRHIISAQRGLWGLLAFSAAGFVPLLIVPNNQQLIFVGLIGVVIGLMVLIYHWIGWYFTVYILTNQRIRQNIQKGLFTRSVVDVGLDKIQSAFVKVEGLVGNLLQYGTIILHTQVGDMVIKRVSQAEAVYAKMQDEIGKVEYQGSSNEAE